MGGHRRRRRGAGLGGHRRRAGLQRRRRPRHDRGHDRRLRGRPGAVARRPVHRRVHARRREARRVRREWGGRGCRPGRGPPGRRQHRGDLHAPVGRARAPRCGRRGPRRAAVAAVVRHGQGQVLLAHRRLHRRPRGRTHRAGYAVRARRGRARRGPGRGATPGSGQRHRRAVDQAGDEPVVAPARRPPSGSRWPSRCSGSSAPTHARAWRPSASGASRAFPRRHSGSG